MLVLVVFLHMVGMGYAFLGSPQRVHIFSGCDKLLVWGANSCEITHNDKKIHYTGPKLQIFPNIFGLITYECDKTAGHLISEIRCGHCGYECSSEEPSEDGSSSWTFGCLGNSGQDWLAVILGLVLAALIGGCFFKHLRKTLDGRRCDQFSHQKLSGKNGSVTVAYDNDQELLKDDFEPNCDRSGPADSPKTKPLSGKNTLVSLLVSMLLVKTATPCNVTVFMESNRVTLSCQGDVCTNWEEPAFHMEVGQEFCIMDTKGGKVSLRISEIVVVHRFDLTYYTSDYRTVNFSSTGTCCSPSADCSIEDDECSNRTMAMVTQEYAKNLEKKFECLTLTDDHDYGEVTKKVGCVYFGKKERIGELYAVYKIAGRETWEVKLVSDHHEPIILNTFKPTYSMVDFKLQKVDKIPINIINVMERRPEVYDDADSLLLLDEEAYFVATLDRESVSNGMIGDFQISLDKSKEKYSVPEGHCAILNSTSCLCDCSPLQTDSAMRNFLLDKETFKRIDNFTYQAHNLSIIHVRTTHKEGGVLMHLGNRRFDHEEQGGRCDFRVVTSYGCSNCNRSSYVVLQAFNVEKVGSVHIMSNCSFNTKFLWCQHHSPIKLALKEKYRFCDIRMPALEKQILVNVKYINLRKKTLSNQQQNCTVGNAFKDYVTSGRFIGIFVLTIVLSLLSSSFLIVLFRVLQTLRNRF